MQNFKVLVVDDFETFRQFVCSVLQETAGFTVVGQASDGLEAVEKAEQLQPHLVLLDIALPKLNGIEAARRISVVAPGSKVLFLSANSDPDVVKAALSEGAYGYVAKSAASGELVTALASVARGERFVSPTLASALGRYFSRPPLD